MADIRDIRTQNGTPRSIWSVQNGRRKECKKIIEIKNGVAKVIWLIDDGDLIIKIIISSGTTQTVKLSFVGVYDWGDGSPKETSTFPWTVSHTYPLSDTDKEYTISIKIDERYYKEHYTTTIQTFPEDDGDYIKSVYIPASYTIGCPSITINAYPNIEKIEFEKDCRLRQFELYYYPRDNENNTLKKLNIPNAVSVQGIYNFSELEKLTINFIDGTVYNNIQGVFTTSNCPKIKKLTITGAAKRIRIPGCSALEKFVVPEGLTEIYKDCFRDCTSLSDVTIPETVTLLGDNSFRNCTALTEITLPASVKRIGESYGNKPFYGSGLKTIKGVAGSYAETYAKNNGYEFVAI